MTSPAESTSQLDLPEDKIADRLRLIRDRLGINQAEFSRRTKEHDPEGRGISRTVLVGYEAGKFKPGARELRIICQTFAVAPSWLLFGDEKASDRPETDDEAELEDSFTKLRGVQSLSGLFSVALNLVPLKQHELDAVLSLVRALAGARRGRASQEAIERLADQMALDAELRLAELTGSREAAASLLTHSGADVIEHFAELYFRAYEDRWGVGPDGRLKK